MKSIDRTLECTRTPLEPFTVRFLRPCYGDDKNQGMYLILDEENKGTWSYLVLVEDDDDDNERAGTIHHMSGDWLIDYTEPYGNT